MHRRVSRLIALLALFAALTAVHPLHAQRIASQPAGITMWRSEPNPVRRAALDSIAPNNWAKGALIGGAIGAGLGFFLVKVGEGISDNSVNTTPIIFGSAVVFALIGGMIGSFSPQKE